MFIYETISTDDGRFKLSAIIEKGVVIDVSFEICEAEDKRKVDAIWDNEDYLINELWTWLCRSRGELKDIELEGLFGEYEDEVWEMFNMAITRGYFKNIK